MWKPICSSIVMNWIIAPFYMVSYNSYLWLAIFFLKILVRRESQLI